MCTLTLSSPITEEQWDILEDVDFDHTDRIWFHTRNGKDVEFIKKESIYPVKPITEEDIMELRDRFGDYVAAVINDMISRKEKRWEDR